MRREDNERCRQDDPRLREGFGQKMDKRILNGAAKNNFLNEAAARVDGHDQDGQRQRISVEERELEERFLKTFEFKEGPI